MKPGVRHPAVTTTRRHATTIPHDLALLPLVLLLLLVPDGRPQFHVRMRVMLGGVAHPVHSLAWAPPEGCRALGWVQGDCGRAGQHRLQAAQQ